MLVDTNVYISAFLHPECPIFQIVQQATERRYHLLILPVMVNELGRILEDPPDDRVLECAVEGRANLIVSGDRHLRRLRIYQDIPIVRPIDSLRMLGVT